MTRFGPAWAAGVAMLAAAAATPTHAASPLTVCLERHTPPFSDDEHGKATGFDVAVSQAVAQQLQRSLSIRWFQIHSPPDEDDPDPSRAENALLHAGKCQLIGGFPLIANDLSPETTASRMADVAGMTPAERKAYVPIGKLAASTPYYYIALTVLLGPRAGDKKIATLADLEGLRIGSEDGTLADAILMWYGHRRYFRQIVHFTPGKTLEHGGGLLDHLERGDIDATLVELRRYDVYRAQHPGSKIQPTGFYDRIGFNVGFVAPASDTVLIGQVDGALAALRTNNKLPTMAQAEGMTYVAPRAPAVASPPALGDLMSDD